MIVGLDLLYLLMGQASSSLRDLDLEASTVLCVGLSSDILYSAQNESTNQILKKLKGYGEGQMFKYRVRDPEALDYFSKHSKLVVEMRPWKEARSSIVIFFLEKNSRLRMHNLMVILKKEMSIDHNESLFLYRRGKLRLCQPHEELGSLESYNKEGETEHLQLEYSKMEISG